MNGKVWVPGDHVHLDHGVINGLQLMLALFKVEGCCDNDKRIRQLNILLYMSVNSLLFFSRDHFKVVHSVTCSLNASHTESDLVLTQPHCFCWGNQIVLILASCIYVHDKSWEVCTKALQGQLQHHLDSRAAHWAHNCKMPIDFLNLKILIFNSLIFLLHYFNST